MRLTAAQLAALEARLGHKPTAAEVNAEADRLEASAKSGPPITAASMPPPRIPAQQPPPPPPPPPPLPSMTDSDRPQPPA